MDAVRRVLTPIVATAIILGTGATQAAGPSFDCAGAKAGSVDAIICASPTLAALDVETTRLYGLTVASSAGGNATALKDEQTRWLTERGKCATAKMPQTCARDRYMERIAWLRTSQKAARGADGKGISIGPLTFRCNGIDGLVGATFVRSEPALAYVERKGVHLVLEAQPAASGAKYGSDEGPSFWTRRGEAMYRERAGAGEVKCTVEAIG